MREDVFALISLAIVCMIPIFLFGFSAILFYKGISNAIWFLVASLILCANINYKECDCDYEPEDDESGESKV